MLANDLCAGSLSEAVLQYDYLTAYLDFYNPDGPKVAGAIAKKYKNYPIAKVSCFMGFCVAWCPVVSCNEFV